MSTSTSNVQDLLASLDNIDADTLKQEANASDVLTVLYAARRLVRRLETPFQHVHHVTTHATQISYCLLILLDMGVWESWRKVGGGEEASLTEVWERCTVPCDIALLRRFLAMMAANGIIDEAGENRWRPTAVALALGDKNSTAYNALMFWKNVTEPSCRNLPHFLAHTDYQNPLDRTHCNFMDVTDPGRYDCWQLFARDPEVRRNFSGYMKGQLEFRLDWTEVYDLAGILEGGGGGGGGYFDQDRHIRKHDNNDDDDEEEGTSDESGSRQQQQQQQQQTLLVDVGGNYGHDLDRVLARAPDLPAGCLVLQDLPNVLADAVGVDERIVKMPYDFFEPQPVVGSRAYLLHWVLHDWGDADAYRILRNLAAAMTRGYSKLLVCDYSMPPVGATRTQTSSDFAMMHLLSAQDRTEEAWYALLGGAGFEILKVWKHPVSGDSVFEAVLAG